MGLKKLVIHKQKNETKMVFFNTIQSSNQNGLKINTQSKTMTQPAKSIREMLEGTKMGKDFPKAQETKVYINSII